MNAINIKTGGPVKCAGKMHQCNQKQVNHESNHRMKLICMINLLKQTD